jgi:uncharacterized protein YkwD
MKRSLNLLLSLAATVALGLPATTSAGEYAGSAEAFAQRVLASHNRERARMGLPSLRWSARLSQDAGSWAGSLARRGTLEHSDGDDGENLWMGSANWYSPEQMVGDFISERSAFRPGRFPNVSRTGDWSDVGHYTQIIWPETQAVGCALARDRGQEVLVCRYWPAGNVEGERVG